MRWLEITPKIPHEARKSRAGANASSPSTGPKRLPRLLVAPLLSALLPLSACGPCDGRVRDTDERPAPEEDDNTDSLVREESWREGKLPPHVLEGEPTRGGTVTIRAYYEPDSLNPISSGDGMASWIVLHNVSEALVRPDLDADDASSVLPGLARSFEIQNEGLTHSFDLRRDARWHDGEPVTSKDVAATFEKLTDPQINAGSLGPVYSTMLESVETPDEHTVLIRWKQPYFLALTTLARTPIQPAHILEELDARGYNELEGNPMHESPTGSGPFRLAAWERGSRIVLERNEDWWGEGPWLDRVIFEIVASDDEARNLAGRGELDVWDAVEPRTWVDLDQDETIREVYHRSRRDSGSHVFIGWNGRRPHLDDPSVRVALAMLIDRDGIMKETQKGLASEATCHFFPSTTKCDPSLEPLPHDPAAAATLLEEAGWESSSDDGLLRREGSTFEIDLLVYSASPAAKTIASMMQESFLEAGIVVRSNEVEWKELTHRLRGGELDAAVLMHRPGPKSDPAPYWHSTSAFRGANHFGFSSDGADEIIERARGTLDPEERQEMMRELGRILHEEQPITLLYHPDHLALVHERIRGVRPGSAWWQPSRLWVAED